MRPAAATKKDFWHSTPTTDALHNNPTADNPHRVAMPNFSPASPSACASSQEAVPAPLRGTGPPPIGPESPWLAPLAGFSDLPFRLLCREQGAAVACTEMVSAKGLIYGLRQRKKSMGTPTAAELASVAHLPPSASPLPGEVPGEPCTAPLPQATPPNGTEELLSTTPDDNPLVVQLFGAEPEFLSAALLHLRQCGFRWFDLNMGCSVPKVTKTGAGAAMLRDPAHAVVAAKALAMAAPPGTVGCKIRLGWHMGDEVYVDLARALEDAGIGWITLHPRFARQAFSGAAAEDALGTLANAVRVPVLASGDLFSAEDALGRITRQGVHGVMFARGAMENPFIFRDYHALRQGCAPAPPTPGDLHALILRHAELAKAYTPGKPGRSGYPPALLKMRTVVPRYVRRLPHVKQLRLALGSCTSWEHFAEIIAAYFTHTGP